MLKTFFKLAGAYKENTAAYNKAADVFDQGGTLEDILLCFSDATDHELDDAAIKSFLDFIYNAQNTFMNASVLLFGISHNIKLISDALHDSKTKPLKILIEEINEEK